MSTPVTINGSIYQQPNQGTPPPWGDLQASIIAALASSTLQKNGGVFTLTNPLDFGASNGVSSISYSSRTANPSTAGIVRLAVSDSIGWRNNANNGNLLFSVNASDNILFNGVELATSSASIETSAASGSFTTTSLTLVDVTNLNVTLASDGSQAIKLELCSDNTSAGGQIGLANGVDSTTNVLGCQVAFLRDSTVISLQNFGKTTVMAGGVQIDNASLYIPPSSFSFIDEPAAGSYTYKVQILSFSANCTVSVTNVKLKGYKL